MWLFCLILFCFVLYRIILFYFVFFQLRKNVKNDIFTDYTFYALTVHTPHIVLTVPYLPYRTVPYLPHAPTTRTHHTYRTYHTYLHHTGSFSRSITGSVSVWWSWTGAWRRVLVTDTCMLCSLTVKHTLTLEIKVRDGMG